MGAQQQTEKQCVMKLLLLAIACIRVDGECVDSHSNYVISWITSNTNNANVFYLGNKGNSGQCQAACQDLNYLCDKSASDVVTYDGGSVSFDNTNCMVTISADAGNNEPNVAITSNLISDQYRIDVELQVTGGTEAGFYFRSNIDNNNYEDVYMGVDPGSQVVTGYDDPTYNLLKQTDPDPQFSTIYTLSVYVNGNSFTTYYEGGSHYSGSFKSSFTDSYAGLYSYHADVVYHSFKVDIMDGSADDKVCAAYVYQSNGNCYGYYGTDFATIKSTLSSNNNYDSAIIYPTTCPQSETTSNPTKRPTSNPTKRPTNKPTNKPTALPSVGPTLRPTDKPTPIPTPEPTASPTPELSQPPSQLSDKPSTKPSISPSKDPSAEPTKDPSAEPTEGPSSEPTKSPSQEPTKSPSQEPSTQPTVATNPPTKRPSVTLDATLDENQNEEARVGANYVEKNYTILITLRDCSNAFCVELVADSVTAQATDIIGVYLAQEVDIKSATIEDTTIAVIVTVVMDEFVQLATDSIALNIENTLEDTYTYGDVEVRIIETDTEVPQSSEPQQKWFQSPVTQIAISGFAVIIATLCICGCLRLRGQKQNRIKDENMQNMQVVDRVVSGFADVLSQPKINMAHMVPPPPPPAVIRSDITVQPAGEGEQAEESSSSSDSSSSFHNTVGQIGKGEGHLPQFNVSRPRSESDKLYFMDTNVANAVSPKGAPQHVATRERVLSESDQMYSMNTNVVQLSHMSGSNIGPVPPPPPPPQHDETGDDAIGDGDIGTNVMYNLRFGQKDTMDGAYGTTGTLPQSTDALWTLQYATAMMPDNEDDDSLDL